VNSIVPYPVRSYFFFATKNAVFTPSGARTLDTLIKSYGQASHEKFLPIIAILIDSRLCTNL
ncbi:MAG: hypothetical protein J6K55_13945, partial [Clostridia bacterium]|nr:hypothetical protein [Clostridia bacterium]